MNSSPPQVSPSTEDHSASPVVTVQSVLRTIGLIAVVGIAAVIVSRLLPPRSEIEGIVDSAGAWGPVLAIGGIAFLLLVLTPRTPLTWIAGALFGWVPAMIYVMAGTMIAAVIGFFLGRAFGRELVAGVIYRKSPGPIRNRIATMMAQADAWLGKHGVIGVGLVRIVPAAPYGLVSYLFGTTGTRTGQYVAGCFIGGLAPTVGNTAIGAAIWGPAAVPVAVGVLLGLAIMTLTVRWWLLRRGGKVLQPQEPPKVS